MKKKKKLWYIYTIEYYSAIKKNEIMLFAAIWMDLDIIILSKVRERQISYYISDMWNFFNVTNEPIYRTETGSQT